MTRPELAHLEGFPGGADWLARLPRLAEECAERWSLRLGDPLPGATVSFAVEAELADGTPAVLKVQFPHWESEHEAAALAHWDGDGAARLLAHDPERHALLLERVAPGTPALHLGEDDGVRAVARVLARIGSRPLPAGHPFTPIAETAGRWAQELPGRWEAAGRPFERALLDAAVEALVELPPTQGPLVLCHQDCHRGNVLLGARGWLAIDPKPVAAERELDVAALVRGDPGDPARRFGLAVSELGLDRERARGWAIAHTIAWGFDEHEPVVDPWHVEVARALRAAP